LGYWDRRYSILSKPTRRSVEIRNLTLFVILKGTDV
jgi:hypothetical protein